MPIIRLYFKDNKYNVSKYPALAILFVWNKRRIKKLCTKVYLVAKRKVSKIMSLGVEVVMKFGADLIRNKR